MTRCIMPSLLRNLKPLLCYWLVWLGPSARGLPAQEGEKPMSCNPGHFPSRGFRHVHCRRIGDHRPDQSPRRFCGCMEIITGRCITSRYSRTARSGFHGSPAELRDIPIGTHMHGYFHLPPLGEGKGSYDPASAEGPSAISSEAQPCGVIGRRRELLPNVAVRDGRSCRSTQLRAKSIVVPTGDLVKDGINTPVYLRHQRVHASFGKVAKLVDLTDIAPEQARAVQPDLVAGLARQGIHDFGNLAR